MLNLCALRVQWLRVLFSNNLLNVPIHSLWWLRWIVSFWQGLRHPNNSQWFSNNASGRVRGPPLSRPMIPGVESIIAVASGKGGVGKSTTAGIFNTIYWLSWNLKVLCTGVEPTSNDDCVYASFSVHSELGAPQRIQDFGGMGWSWMCSHIVRTIWSALLEGHASARFEQYKKIPRWLAAFLWANHGLETNKKVETGSVNTIYWLFWDLGDFCNFVKPTSSDRYLAAYCVRASFCVHCELCTPQKTQECILMGWSYVC